MSYHGFDLNIFLQGVFGNMVNNVWKQESDLWNISVPKGKNHPTRLLDAWSFDNPNSNIPAITNQTVNGENRMSTYFVENGSYLKLRNIEVGYTFPKAIVNKVGIGELRLYANARNVFTLKKSWGDDRYTSFDPEMPGYGYLQPLSFTFGINLKF